MALLEVLPIEGEWFRYHVASASKAGTYYLVDLEENDFVGRCNCPDFTCRHQVRINSGERGRSVWCKHIEAARDVWFDLVARKLSDALNR